MEVAYAGILETRDGLLIHVRVAAGSLVWMTCVLTLVNRLTVEIKVFAHGYCRRSTTSEHHLYFSYSTSLAILNYRTMQFHLLPDTCKSSYPPKAMLFQNTVHLLHEILLS